jgi:uncharacterized protein YegL
MMDDLGEQIDIDYSEAGTGQRLPLLLCLDISGSMQGQPIQMLNDALQDWAAELRSDAHYQGSVFVGIVTFGTGGVRAWRGRELLAPGSGQQPFVPASQFHPPHFTAGQVTLMTEALELAVRHVNAYKAWLKENNYQYYRPLIFLLTDGLPTEANGSESKTWDRIIPELEAGAQNKNFQLFAVGVGHLSQRGVTVLSRLAPDGYHILSGFPFRSLLVQLSKSIEEVMRSPVPGAMDYTLTMPAAAGSGPDDPLSKNFGQRPAAR